MSEINGDLLRMAYVQGYFPMPDPLTEEIMWYSPDPRAVIPLEAFHVSRSLRRKLRRRDFTVTFDRAFEQVIRACAAREETWINDVIISSYIQLHHDGDGHSVEVWKDRVLVGGVYGLSLGGAFFAESKFHRTTDASKVALFYLVQHLRSKGFSLLEVQFMTDHLKSLGAIEISAEQYLGRLQAALRQNVNF